MEGVLFSPHLFSLLPYFWVFEFAMNIDVIFLFVSFSFVGF
jgi:hypothetical protein